MQRVSALATCLVERRPRQAISPTVVETWPFRGADACHITAKGNLKPQVTSMRGQRAAVGQSLFEEPPLNDTRRFALNNRRLSMSQQKGWIAQP